MDFFLHNLNKRVLAEHVRVLKTKNLLHISLASISTIGISLLIIKSCMYIILVYRHNLQSLNLILNLMSHSQSRPKEMRYFLPRVKPKTAGNNPAKMFLAQITPSFVTRKQLFTLIFKLENRFFSFGNFPFQKLGIHVTRTSCIGRHYTSGIIIAAAQLSRQITVIMRDNRRSQGRQAVVSIRENRRHSSFCCPLAASLSFVPLLLEVLQPKLFDCSASFVVPVFISFLMKQRR
jgi:hypothetical protein